MDILFNERVTMNEGKNKFEKLKSVFFSPQFGKFVSIGLVDGFNGVFFSFLFSRVLGVNLSFVIGYFVSLCISYFLNSMFVFKRRINIERYVKFCISYIPNFIIQNIGVFIMFNCFGWHEIAAFILAAVFGVPVTYVILNLLTFKTIKR